MVGQKFGFWLTGYYCSQDAVLGEGGKEERLTYQVLASRLPEIAHLLGSGSLVRIPAVSAGHLGALCSRCPSVQ